MDEMGPQSGTTGLPPAGWYPDQRDSDQERWWDGAEWTATVRAGRLQRRSNGSAGTGGTAPGAGPSTSLPRQPSAPARGPLARRRWLAPVAYAVGALVVFSLGRASASAGPEDSAAYRALEQREAMVADELAAAQAALTRAEHERDDAESVAAEANAQLDTAALTIADLEAGIVTTTITAIVDGDTVDTGAGGVRIIGIDAPEQGQCNYTEAAQSLAELIPVGASVRLIPVDTKGDTDQYGRLLRYVEADGVDVGAEQIASGYANARYDSRDGAGAHPREAAYISADAAHAPPDDSECAVQERAAAEAAAAAAAAAAAEAQAAAQAQAAAEARAGCGPSYPTVCIPPAPPDLDCGDISFRRFEVTGRDPHGFDGDSDGIGCES